MGVASSTRGDTPPDAPDFASLAEQLAEIRGLVTTLAPHPTPSGFGWKRWFAVMLLFGFVVAFLWSRFQHTIFRLTQRYRRQEVMKTLARADPAELRRILHGLRLPSWMITPDVERTAWLNSMIAQLWPSICRMAKDWVDENMDELLRQSSPGWIRSIKMTRFTLGDVPPAIDGVKAFDASQPGGGGRRDSITLEFDFGWAGEQEAHLTVQPVPKYLKIPLPGGAGGPLSKLDVFNLVLVKVGVERLIVSGRVRVTLGPLSSKPPFFGAVQVSLVGQPQFDFGLDAYGGDLSLLPGLEGWIHSMLCDAVFAPYTLPERLVIPMTDDPALLQDRPIGMLQVCAIEARNVPRMDLLSKSDPYLELFARVKRRLRTQVIDDNEHPVWDERFAFPIYSMQQELTAILYDYDLLSADDEIGRFVIPLEQLPPDVEIDAWFPIVTPEQEREQAKQARKRKHLLRRRSKKKKMTDGDGEPDDEGLKDERTGSKGKGAGNANIAGAPKPDAISTSRPANGGDDDESPSPRLPESTSRTASATGISPAPSERPGDVVRIVRGGTDDDGDRDERLGHPAAKAVSAGSGGGGKGRDDDDDDGDDDGGDVGRWHADAHGGAGAARNGGGAGRVRSAGASYPVYPSNSNAPAKTANTARDASAPAPSLSPSPSPSRAPSPSPLQSRVHSEAIDGPRDASRGSSAAGVNGGIKRTASVSNAASCGDAHDAYRRGEEDLPRTSSASPESPAARDSADAPSAVARRSQRRISRPWSLLFPSRSSTSSSRSSVSVSRRAKDGVGVGGGEYRGPLPDDPLPSSAPASPAPGSESTAETSESSEVLIERGEDGHYRKRPLCLDDLRRARRLEAPDDWGLSDAGSREGTLSSPTMAQRTAIGGGLLVEGGANASTRAPRAQNPSRLSSESPRGWGTGGGGGMGTGTDASAGPGQVGPTTATPGSGPSPSPAAVKSSRTALENGRENSTALPDSKRATASSQASSRAAAAAEARGAHDGGGSRPPDSPPSLSTFRLPAGGRLVSPPPESSSSPRGSHLTAQGLRHGAVTAMRGMANAAVSGTLGKSASSSCEVRLRLRFTPYDGVEVKKMQEQFNAGVPAREILRNVPQSLREGLTGGLLRVRVLKAVDLPPTPLHRNVGLRSIKISVSFAGDTKRTTAIGGNKTTYPFDQLLEFVAFGTAIDQSSEVEIEVWDVRFRNYLLGTASIPLSKLVHGDVNDVLPLQGPHSKGKGVVVVEASWMSALTAVFQGGG